MKYMGRKTVQLDFSRTPAGVKGFVRDDDLGIQITRIVEGYFGCGEMADEQERDVIWESRKRMDVTSLVL